MENNQVVIMGTIVSEFKYSHEIFGEGFYMVDVEVQRLSETITECAQRKQELALQSEEELAELKKIISGKDEFTEQRGALLSEQSELEQAVAAARKEAATSEAALRQADRICTSFDRGTHHH